MDKFGPAAEGIVEPIRDIVNTGGELAKNVLPEVAEGMKFLAKNTKTAIPIVTGLVAAYKELKITKQLGDSTTTLGKAVKNSSSWWKTAQTAIGRYAEQMEAAKYTGRQYNVTLTAGQSVLGLFQRKVSLAAASTNILKAAQEGLTKAIEANPIGLAVVATTAMIAVSTAMRNKLSEQTEAEKAHSRALKDSAKEAETNLKVAQDRKQSYEDLVATQDNPYS